METKGNNLVRVKLSDIDLHEEDLKEHDAQLYQKLKACVSKRGQLKTILVYQKEGGRYECLEGSKVVKILRELGAETALSIDLGELTEAEKNLIKIEVSRDYFLTNYVKIGAMLKQLTEEGKLAELCATIPFDIRQAEHLISMTEFDWDAFTANKQNEGQVSLFDAIEEVETDSFIEDKNPQSFEEYKVHEQEIQKEMTEQEKENFAEEVFESQKSEAIEEFLTQPEETPEQPNTEEFN